MLTRRHWLLSILASVGASHTLRADDLSQGVRGEYLEIRMGVPVRIVVEAPSEEAADAASQAAYDRIRALDRILSDYDPDSELMKLCTASQPGQPTIVSEDLFRVLSQAQEMSRLTEGAFDVTVGPLTKMWRVARRRKTLPNPQALKNALALVDYEAVELDHRNLSVTLHRPGMRIDLGAIGKGYAADEAAHAMAKQGLTITLVAVAGDIRVEDPPQGRPHWRVEVEKLRDDEGDPFTLNLKHRAVTTSGDTYQYVEIDGIRYSHIVNPKTGLGLTTPRSVTVIAPTAMLADALATSCCVMGWNSALKLFESLPDCEACFSTAGINDEISRTVTSGFMNYVFET